MSITSISYARDTKYLLPITPVLSTDTATQKLDGSVRFFFADQKHPRVAQSLGTEVVNPKTNSFGKSDEKACNWVFLSAMIALQDQARQQGADGVINIVSYYKKNEMSSNTDFECHAGAAVAGVALKGELVKFAKK